MPLSVFDGKTHPLVCVACIERPSEAVVTKRVFSDIFIVTVSFCSYPPSVNAHMTNVNVP